MPALVGTIGLVGRVIGVRQLVVFRFGDAPERDLEPRQAPESLMPETAFEVFIEQSVMPELVSGDMAEDLLQHRFFRRFPQRAVIGARSDLDDAARDHLARA